jgi:hypothetical protein
VRDLNWGFWAASLIAGGVIGAAVESVTGWLTGWRQRKHETSLQSREHDHLRQDHEADRDHQRELQAQNLRHDRDMKALDRLHERLRRRDANHDEHRESFATSAADFVDWVAYEAGTKHGPSEADWYPELSGPPALSTPDEAAAALRRIALMHPTREVREAADRLHGSFAGHYGSILPNEDGHLTTRTEPSFEELLGWEQGGRALMEMIHEPPPDGHADAANA